MQNGRRFWHELKTLLETSLSQGDRLGVKFFDFVDGSRGRCGWSGDFHFDEGFGELLGVYFERIGRRVLASSLRIGVSCS